jgi:tetratricopeptide (TPR) repeat protein
MKRMAVIIALTLGLLVPALVHANPQLAAQWVQYGTKQYQAKQYDAAMQSFNKAIQIDKANASAYQGLGYCLWAKGDKAKGEQYIAYAKKLQGTAPAAAAQPAGGGAAALIAKGNQYFQAKQYPYAAYYYNQATQAEPNNAQAWQMLGTAFYFQGNKAKALQAFEKSLQLNPNNPQLQSYVNNLRGGDAGAGGEKEQAAWVPYVMGGVVVVLGAIMIFLF